MSGSDNHSVHSYNPLTSIPIQRRENHSRRGSILDTGGVSSINNFASSLQRSVNFLAKSFDSQTIGNDILEEGQISQSPLLISHDDLNTVLLDEELLNHTSQAERETERGRETEREIGIGRGTNFNIKRYGSIVEDGEEIIRVMKSNDTEIIKVVSLKSTPIQTIFNSINVLIGLGILSIPLALHLSGWILGVICITFAAMTTQQTSILLGKILNRHPQLKTYQDIGVFCFGDKIGTIILLTFTLDLIGAGISMILLFADSFNALSPQIFSKFELKLAITILLMFLNFLPLRLLSFLSLTGIICTTATCLTIAICGFIKIDNPGSLLHPMPTNLFPKSTIDFFFALGLYLAPWGGHATFPEIYKDQLYPETYSRSMKFSFSFSYMIDLITGVLGFLMFGEIVDDEITKNIITTKGYPRWISTIIVVLMGILPISKLPLISRPLLTILDRKFGGININSFQKIVNRFALSFLFLMCSIFLTNFGKVMSLLGSLICFTVCITLPGLYYLQVFKGELSFREQLLWRILVAVGVAGAILGTVAVLLK